MRYLIRLFTAACCAIAVFIAGPARAEKRLALAVGIDLYDNLPAHEQLRKAVNDARAVAAAFRDVGFEATVEENLSSLAFTRAWQRFLNRLEPGDTAALFFAGHGVEIGGANYLLPRDVPKVGLSEDRVLARASIRFNDLLDDLRERKARVAIFIVDACRDNPFRDERGRSIGGTRGLSRVDPAKGTFVMYSAGVGEKALDRLHTGDNEITSPYTRTLLPILKTPGLSLQQIATRVRAEVVELTRRAQPPHEQTPAYYDQLLGEFVLKPGSAADAKPTVPSLPQPSAAAIEWARVDKSSLPELETFERRHPASAEAEYARARLKELRKVAVVTPPPPPVVAPPKPAEPAAGVFTPGLTPLTRERERALKPGDSFRECDACPQMMVVPAGSFMMGSPASEKGREDTEGPQRRVTIARPFAVGKFEVTRGEFAAFMRESGRTVGDKCFTFENGEWTFRTGRSFRNPAFSQDDRHPAVCVSWEDAAAFVAWLSSKTGKTYRLLTEAEWEYAARAGATTRYHFGDDERDLCKYGNVADRTARQAHKSWTGTENCRDGFVYTAPVGSFQTNAFGLHDMHGNAWELVQDCWHGSYSGAPSDGSAWTAIGCSSRVLRGGSGVSNPQDVRSAMRHSVSPNDHINSNGFRVARTLLD